MFLSDKEKSAKSEVLAELSKKLEGMRSSRMAGRGKPAVAEISVAEIEPEEEGGKLGKMMGGMHEMGESEESGEGISEEQKMMIEELYNRYCRN